MLNKDFLSWKLLVKYNKGIPEDTMMFDSWISKPFSPERKPSDFLVKGYLLEMITNDTRKFTIIFFIGLKHKNIYFCLVNLF